MGKLKNKKSTFLGVKPNGNLAVFETISGKGVALKIRAGIGKGEEVVILGAGVGGLTAAYELLKSKADYDKVPVLEARDRVGGRSLTLRPGDKFTEVIKEGPLKGQSL